MSVKNDNCEQPWIIFYEDFNGARHIHPKQYYSERGARSVFGKMAKKIGYEMQNITLTQSVSEAIRFAEYKTDKLKIPQRGAVVALGARS